MGSEANWGWRDGAHGMGYKWFNCILLVSYTVDSTQEGSWVVVSEQGTKAPVMVRAGIPESIEKGTSRHNGNGLWNKGTLFVTLFTQGHEYGAHDI